MRITLTSNELWEDLEVEALSLAEDIRFTDEILSEKCTSLVNHFNGNMATDKQRVCIGKVKSIIEALSTKNYFVDRKYTEAQTVRVSKFKEDLLMLSKVLTSEQREFYQKQKEEANKPKLKEERLPNINSEKVVNMYKDLDNDKRF